MRPWQDAVDLVLSQRRPALAAILAAAFAAPLIRFTGQPGVLMSAYSPESGIGKTTAMMTAQAAWGDPVKAMMGLDDTQNAVLRKLGQLRHLPLFWDELKTEDDTRRMINTLFRVTGGREKARLNSNVETREMGEWETILISASNESMIDYVVNRTKMTTAGVNRLFEFTVSPGKVGQIPVADASRIVMGLKGNYGLAGLVYSQFLGANFERIDKDIANELAAVNGDVGVTPDERFWSALVAVITLGAKYANELQLTNFDLGVLRGFMIGEFTNMRKLRSDQPIDMQNPGNVSNLLVEFLRDMQPRNILITETMWMGRGKPKPGSVKTLLLPQDSMKVHRSSKDHRLRISLSALQNWLEQKHYARHMFIEALRKQFGATRGPGTLGAGTSAAWGVEMVLEIDLLNPTAKKYLSEQQ